MRSRHKSSKCCPRDALSGRRCDVTSSAAGATVARAGYLLSVNEQAKSDQVSAVVSAGQRKIGHDRDLLVDVKVISGT